VDELVLPLAPAPPPVLLDERRIGKLGLWVLVERLRVGVGRQGVEVEVALLHVLAVIALRPREPEEPLLQDGIALVLQREREAEPALAVRKAEEPVLAPAVGAAAGVVVGKVLPARDVSRVVLADRAPLALGEVGAPALPVLLPPRVLGEPRALRVLPGHRCLSIGE